MYALLIASFLEYLVVMYSISILAIDASLAILVTFIISASISSSVNVIDSAYILISFSSILACRASKISQDSAYFKSSFEVSIFVMSLGWTSPYLKLLSTTPSNEYSIELKFSGVSAKPELQALIILESK